MISVDQATADDIARFFGGIRLTEEFFGLAGRKGRLVVGIGGVIKSPEGQWRGFMDVPDHVKTPMIYRYAKRILAEASARGAKSVQVACDDQVPRASEFLERLGFIPTEEVQNNMVIWVWQH